MGAGCGSTPTEYLRKAEAPVFKAGHQLPPLTRWGWTLPLETRIELAERWGYALAFGAATESNMAHVDSGFHDGGRVLRLVADDPETYRLSVMSSRELPAPGTVPDTAWVRDASGRFVDAKGAPLESGKAGGGGRRVWSPAAPTEVWEAAGRLQAGPIEKIRELAPITIILHGGESGIGVAGHHRKAWESDPRIREDRAGRPWFPYVSARKAQAETIIAEAIQAAAPDAAHYIDYGAGGNLARNRFAGWKHWAHGFGWMRAVPTLPSAAAYYQHFNSGWTGRYDLLTNALNARGREIALGQPHAYGWVCGGWKAGKFSEIPRYQGFLKCLYASGMVGAVAGYFDYPKGGFDALFEKDDPPHWLRQLMALAEVHAEFSHHDSFLLESELLPGPDRHRWSQDQPAYEFPTGDPDARVLARKHREKDEWLIVAWAAAGEARNVTVSIPELGRVELEARPEGTVRVFNGDG